MQRQVTVASPQPEGGAPQESAAPVHGPALAQKLDGRITSASAASTARSQSLSRPSQTSGPDGVHWYSQPGAPSASVQPGSHASAVQTPAEQPSKACSNAQAVQLAPQFRGSFCLSKPLSIWPLQSLSLPSRSEEHTS